jgi:hypothetical protein
MLSAVGVLAATSTRSVPGSPRIDAGHGEGDEFDA